MVYQDSFTDEECDLRIDIAIADTVETDEGSCG